MKIHRLQHPCFYFTQLLCTMSDTVIYKYTSQLTPRPISTLSIICMITRCTSYSNCHFCFRQTVEYMMAYESHCQALSSSTTVNLYWLTFKLVGKWQWEKNGIFDQTFTTMPYQCRPLGVAGRWRYYNYNLYLCF